MDGARHRPRDTGFTLLELMVALALTGLLSLIAFTGLNLSLKSLLRGQSAAAELQELRVGENILERSICSAINGVQGTPAYFVGDSTQMRFFTLLPLEAYSLGGPYRWQVLLGQDDAGRGVVAVEQTKELNWRRDPEGVETRQIILHNVTALRFTYGAGGKELSIWDGKKEGQIPEWVRVEVSVGGQKPQEWVFPIHAAMVKKQREAR